VTRKRKKRLTARMEGGKGGEGGGGEFFFATPPYGDEDSGGLFALLAPGVRPSSSSIPANANQTRQTYLAQQAQLWLADTLLPTPGGDVQA